MIKLDEQEKQYQMQTTKWY